MAGGAPIPGEQHPAALVPFGLGEDKPHHYLALARAAWHQRGKLGRSWRLLHQGVCDGCALGPRGLRDEVLPGVHLCIRRLDDLRLQHSEPLVPADLVDIGRLRDRSPQQLLALGRLPAPFRYRAGGRGFERLSWEQALDLAGRAAAETPGARQGWLAGPDELPNETAYSLARSARLLGSPNLALTTGPIHAGAEGLLHQRLGAGASTASLSDLLDAQLVLVVGSRLSEEQPVATRYLEAAQRRGARVVVIDAVRDPGLVRSWDPASLRSALFGAQLADDLVQVPTGGQAAFLRAVLERLRGGELDAPLQRGSPAAAHLPWVAELVGRASSMVSLLGTVPGRAGDGAAEAAALLDLHQHRGQLGRPGCGILLLPASGGVQGGLDCGMHPGRLPGGLPLPPDSAPGLDLDGQLDAAAHGQLDLLYVVGDALSPPLAQPQHLARACARTATRVHQDLFLRPEHLVEPGEQVLLLPSQARFEHHGGTTLTSTERRVRFSPEIGGHRVGDARPGWWIPTRVALRARPKVCQDVDFADIHAVRADMEARMPRYRGVASLGHAGDWVQWGGARRG